MTPPPSAQKPLTLGKKRRLGELVIESGIKILSFASIAAIVLIFVFVFREAAPVIFGDTKGEHITFVDSVSTDTSYSIQDADGSQPTDTTESKTVSVIKSKSVKDADIKVKVDASGKKKQVTTGGGNIEQEVYDPFAEETTPTEEEKAEPAVQDTILPVTKKEPVKKYTSTSGGKIEQEVYDPFAEEEGGLATIPTDKGSRNVAKTDTTVKTAAEDSLALIATAATADSLAAKVSRDSIQSGQSTDFENLFFGNVWQPVSTVPKYGFIPLFIGTLKVTLIALLFGSPLAILAALFTSSFAPKWARELLKPTIELLAGFPSVVIGFFALIVMATILQDTFGYQYRLNSFVGGIAMSFAIIPIIYTISEDALTAVPQALRDASTALGATKWQTAFRVVLPSAVPGVFAAVILGFGRAFGETMIALMATGNAAITSADPFEPVRTFAATIGAEMAEVVFGDEHYGILFLIGAMLFIFTFTLNAIVEFYVRKRLIKRIQGK